MITTLWIGDATGSDRLTIGIMLIIMFALPAIIRRLRGPVAPLAPKPVAHGRQRRRVR